MTATWRNHNTRASFMVCLLVMLVTFTISETRTRRTNLFRSFSYNIRRAIDCQGRGIGRNLSWSSPCDGPSGSQQCSSLRSLLFTERFCQVETGARFQDACHLHIRNWSHCWNHYSLYNHATGCGQDQDAGAQCSSALQRCL